jgi:uncharacterized protein (TIGR03790 family)
MNRRCCNALVVACCHALAARLWAGGSGLNVAVVVNQNSTNSVELGNYYCERRQVPPQNLLRATNWTGGNITWNRINFEATILNPLLAMLSARQLTNQIDYVVLSMDFPYQLTDSNGVNSTTSTLFYGFKPDLPASPMYNPSSCNLPPLSSNAYAFTEGVFRATPPVSASSNSFLVMMITSSNLAEAKATVDNGVLGDSTMPTQTVNLTKTTDVARNVRYVLLDNAIFDTRLRGNYAMARTNVVVGLDCYNADGLGNLLGYQTGVSCFSMGSTTFVPGAMADNLTSYGGSLFQSDATGQTPLLVFLNAGACASYGTVVEPCNHLGKFPSPLNYVYQARGFSVAECYYQSITNPYQGLLVGEPLAAPFAQPASGSWSNLSANVLLSGVTNLSLQFNASDANHPIQQVDLFVDGTFAQTLTNIPPRQGNVLTVNINGFAANYMIPANATIKSVASNLTVTLNLPAYTNVTKVMAFAHGDRIELQSFDTNKPGSHVSISISNTVGSAAGITTFVTASRTNFLDTIAWGILQFNIAGTVVPGDYLQLTATKTNGAQVTVLVTNSSTNTTLNQFIQQLMNAINATNALQGSDGLVAEDLTLDDVSGWDFNLRARGQGLYAAQIQASIQGTFTISPAGTLALNANLPDLQPRNQLYITAGVTNLPLTFAFNTVTQADGFHELTAVVYEGSHVRTQQRVAQTVRIKNTTLTAVFTTLVGDTNTALEATLVFSVIANNTAAKIELFSTGGSLGTVSNQASSTFSVAATNLGVGLHPFYAVVTGSSAKQYRTATKWIRIIGAEPPFSVAVAAPPPRLAWPAIAGRLYDILSATSLATGFQIRGAVTPTNSAGQWTETNSLGPQRFYRVQAAP